MLTQLLTRVSLIVVVIAQAGAGAQAPTPRGQPPARPAQSENAETRDINLRAYVELLRSDVRSQAVALITQMMEFTEAEDAAFWPIYRDLELELAKINDERLGLIHEYANSYDKMTDAIADRLATKSLELESRRTAVKSTYYDRLQDEAFPKDCRALSAGREPDPRDHRPSDFCVAAGVEVRSLPWMARAATPGCASPAEGMERRSWLLGSKATPRPPS